MERLRFKSFLLKSFRSESGAVIILVAILLTALAGLAAFAVDLGHLSLAKQELQNAADAGALAGAATLIYNEELTFDSSLFGSVNTGANIVAKKAATANKSENAAVEIVSIKRGHWTFNNPDDDPCTGKPSNFLCNENFTDATELWDLSTEELDADINFINAVRVVTRSPETVSAGVRVPTLFARILGIESMETTAEAVAYRGFSGKLEPGEADAPIAICKQSLLIDGKYTCSIGRMIDSSSTKDSGNTGGWTNFDQTESESCSDTTPTSGNSLTSLMDNLHASGCAGKLNVNPLLYGQYMSTNGGAVQTVFSDFRDCWWSPGDPQPEQPWQMTLPVVDCDEDDDGVYHNVGTCARMVGAVTVNVIWATDGGANSAKPAEAPGKNGAKMRDWQYSDPYQCTDFKNLLGLGTDVALTDPFMTNNGFEDPSRWQGESIYVEGMARWDCFVHHFNLVNADGKKAPLKKKSIYFLPDCEPHEPAGHTGGENFGVLAKFPVLVK